MQAVSSREGHESVGEFLRRQTKEMRVRPKSLVSTFFGDMVMPHDGFAWVETIVNVLELLGINNRLVRTTLFRMREDGWLISTRAGRKSYYELTDHAKRQTEFAESLFYHKNTTDWDGAWTLVFLVMSDIDPASKNELMEELALIGFGVVTRGVWAHPSAKSEVIANRVRELDLVGKVICMRCENVYDQGLGFTIDDQELASYALPSENVAAAYEKFCNTFAPLLDPDGKLQLHGSADELLSLRLILVDEFRRIVLKDRHLPDDLVPENWAGYRAYDLCGQIYRQIFDQTNEHYLSMQAVAGTVSDSTNTIESSLRAKYSSRFSL